MTNTNIITQREQLAKIAEEYRQIGYEILFPPDYEELPDFVTTYNPDLVVRNDRETVVIQVKSNKSLNFTNNQYLSHLAKEVEQYPNWRLELIVTESDDLEISAQYSLQIDEIKSKLPIVEQLAQQYPEAAFLYCWSLIEATIRLLIEKEHLSLKEFDVKRLTKELVFNGVISRSQYQTLKEAFTLRNAIAHGFKADSIDRSYVQKLSQLQHELLVELENN